MSAEMAIAYGCTGPVLRGSGVNWDLRRDGDPVYTELYKDYEFDVIAPDQQGRYPNSEHYPAVPPEAGAGPSVSPDPNV